MSGWTEGDIDANGISIHYHRTGQGDKPSLILSHGFSDNGLCWTRVAKRLEADFDIVMVDARNHGNSDRAAVGPDDMVDDLAAVIAGLALDHPMALGHSMGGSTVAGLAARYPDLVSRIILEDPPWMVTENAISEEGTKKRQEGFKKYIQSLVAMTDEEILVTGKTQHPDWHADEFPAWVASNRQVSDQAMSGLSLGNWEELVAKIQCPALLVYADGDRDGMVKQSVVDKVLATNTLFKASHIQNAGHNTRREQFELYMDAVSGFLI